MFYVLTKSTEKGTSKVRETLEKENLQQDIFEDETVFSEAEKESEVNIEEAYFNKRMDDYIKRTYKGVVRWEYYFDKQPDGHRVSRKPWLQTHNIVHIFLEDETDDYKKVMSYGIMPMQTDFNKSTTTLPSDAKQWLLANYNKLDEYREFKAAEGYSSCTYIIEDVNDEKMIDEIIKILQETTLWEVEKAGNGIFFSWDDNSVI